MFDIGWTEMVVLGIVTLLVVGPRELPGMLRTIGRYVGRVRDMASDFRQQVDGMTDELDARKQFKKFAEQHGFEHGSDMPDLFLDEDLADGDKIAAPAKPAEDDKKSG